MENRPFLGLLLLQLAACSGGPPALQAQVTHDGGGAGDDGGPGAQVDGGNGSHTDSGAGSHTDSGTGSHTDSGTVVPPTGFDAGPITGLNGKTYYVSPSGSDSNAGTSAAPWKTIQHLGSSVAPGDTVIVQAGTYAGAIFGWDPDPCTADDCVIAGTATNPILIEADPAAAPGTVIVNSKNAQTKTAIDLQPGCSYVDIQGFTVKNDGTITKSGIAVAQSTGNRILGNTVDGVGGIGGILVDAVTDVIVQGNTVVNVQGSNTTGHGMYVSGSSVGVQVLDNVVHDNQYIGIHVNGDVSEGMPGVVTGILIAGNRIYANGQNGINADGLQSSTIENNVIYGNKGNGITLYQIDANAGSTGNVIVNNTIDQSSSSGGAGIEVDSCGGCSGNSDSSTGNVAFNNVLLGGAGPTVTVSSADLSTSSNLTSAAAGMFVDSASGNYQLVPTGPCVGKGVATFGGFPAPANATGGFDIGAFAFVQ